MSEYEVRPLPRVSRHATCPTCNHLATLLVEADLCPLREPLTDYCCTPGRHLYVCADESTEDCARRIVEMEDAR